MSIRPGRRQQISEGVAAGQSVRALDCVPGVNAQNRRTMRKDLQISCGVLAPRSSFRRARVACMPMAYPGTMPRRAGQILEFRSRSADRIECLRGPFSALYGNSPAV